MQKRSPILLALGGLVLTNLFWAGNAIVARYATTEIPPFTLAFGRWLLALLILLPFVWSSLRFKWPVIKQNILLIMILGLLGITIYNSILYLAAYTTTAVNMSLVSTSLPLITLLFSWLMLKVRPSAWQGFGIIVSLLGVLIIIMRGDLQALLQLSFNQGDILMFLISCAWSVYSVILRKYPLPLEGLNLLAVLIAAGLPFLLLLAILEGSLVALPDFSIQSVGLFAYISIFPSILAYWFWANGVKTVGPNIAALSCYLMPLFTAILAISILREELHAYHLTGAALILVGLYFGVVFKVKSSA